MRSAELIICEHTGLWAARLRQCHERFFLDAMNRPLPLRRVATWADARAWLDRFPASCVVMEMRPENVAEVFDNLWTCHTRYYQAVCVVVTERNLAAYEWLARELGAAAFFTNARELRPLVKVVQRHLSAAPDLAMEPEQRIWAELPWSE